MKSYSWKLRSLVYCWDSKGFKLVFKPDRNTFWYGVRCFFSRLELIIKEELVNPGQVNLEKNSSLVMSTAQDYKPCLANAVKQRRETMSNRAATATLSITLCTEQKGKAHISVCMCNVPLGLLEMLV